MFEYYKMAFNNYANFTGRARRSEYWYFVLANILIVLSLVFITFLLIATSPNSAALVWVLIILYIMVVFLPSMALVVRRLHDIGKSGWYFFVRFIPFIGGIWLLIMLCTEGERGRNQYGDDPKSPGDEIDEIGTFNY